MWDLKIESSCNNMALTPFSSWVSWAESKRAKNWDHTGSAWKKRKMYVPSLLQQHVGVCVCVNSTPTLSPLLDDLWRNLIRWASNYFLPWDISVADPQEKVMFVKMKGRFSSRGSDTPWTRRGQKSEDVFDVPVTMDAKPAAFRGIQTPPLFHNAGACDCFDINAHTTWSEPN